MPTFLFGTIVFGPVRSRRLGVSLGINLLPVDRKICSFNCIYCECGWTMPAEGKRSRMPGRDEVYQALKTRLSEMKNKGEKPDVITYAGNGEPTLHPEFTGIIEDSLMLRDEYFPEAKISVLSNGSTIHNTSIREALLKVDMNILKLDSVIPDTVSLLNNPNEAYDLTEVIRNMKKLNGLFIIQTLFVRGECNGRSVDNTTKDELDAWLNTLRELRPQSVMIYTIDRDTPSGSNLHKVNAEELKSIASMVRDLGITVTVSG